jgi:phage shock protein E
MAALRPLSTHAINRSSPYFPVPIPQFFSMANTFFAPLARLLFGGSLAAQSGEVLPPKQFAQQLEQRQTVQLIDVRTPQEYKDGHLPGAKLANVQARNFAQQVQQLNPQQPVFLYCRSGRRSAFAAQRMAQMGCDQIYDLQGGIMQWMAQGLPVEN